MKAAEYLRKSRMEEGLDTDQVLSKHKKALAEYAAAHRVEIVDTYYEVASGESLYARPEMLRLLSDVEEGKYEAVLVMDLDRLSRGRMKDQGIILDTFRDSGTLILTPEKTYDLSDEIDDELAEFKTFMSRREYKIINKRLRRGLAQSIQDGCYVANAPYGYRKVVVDRHPTLEIVEEEAKFVRMMYQLYAQGYGCVSVARHINALGARPHRSEAFTRTSVANILRNPTYIGKIVWDQKKHIRKGARGNPKHVTIYQPRDKWTITDGRHPAIVELALYNQVQEILSGRYTPPANDGTVRSPLAGLVRCARCGRHMQRAGTNKNQLYLLCGTPGCCASAKFEYVEERILDCLKDQLTQVAVERPAGVDLSLWSSSLDAIGSQMAAAARQKSKLHELLELGEYDIPTYRERMARVLEKIASLQQREAELRDAFKQASTSPAPAKAIQDGLDLYLASDAAHRNALLKCVLDTVWYEKDKKTRPAEFTLRLELKPF